MARFAASAFWATLELNKTMTTKQILGVLVFVIMGAIMVWQMYRDIGWKGVAWVLCLTGTIVGCCILGGWLLKG